MPSPSQLEDAGYAGRVRTYERSIGLVLWVVLGATLLWVGLR